MNPEDTIANAFVISLVALRMEKNSLFTNDLDFLSTLLKVSQMGRSFIDLLASRIQMQLNDISPNNEEGLKEWNERLLQIIKEKGLEKDQEVLLAAQELFLYENRLMEIIEKHVSHNQQYFSGILAGDSSTDAPPPPPKK